MTGRGRTPLTFVVKTRAAGNYEDSFSDLGQQGEMEQREAHRSSKIRAPFLRLPGEKAGGLRTGQPNFVKVGVGRATPQHLLAGPMSRKARRAAR